MLNHRPSAERRAKLKATENPKPPILSNLCPIERYYNAANKLLAVFESSFEKHELDDCYIYGLRFATFSTVALPTHDYYKSPKPQHTALCKQNQKDVKSVLDRLEEVVQLMDFEELEKQEIKRREEEMQRKIRERELAMRKEEEERKKKEQSRLDDAEIMKKLNMMDELFPRAPTGFGPTQKNTVLPPTAPPPPPPAPPEDNMNESSSSLSLDNLPLPPPIPFNFSNEPQQQPQSAESSSVTAPSLPPPPSYSQLMEEKMHFSSPTIGSTRYNYENLPSHGEKSLNGDLLGGSSSAIQPLYPNSKSMEEPLSSSPLKPSDDWSKDTESIYSTITQPPPKKAEKTVPIATLNTLCTNEYKTLQRIKKIEVFYLSTYQGRVKSPGKDSTNGCTVISPLVAAHHLSSTGSGIADVTIDKIIDDIAPPILTRVRNKLGLGNDALIIPSDVHDYLVDEKILKQEKFVGVCGGNLIDDTHVGEFLKLLENGVDETMEAKDTSDNEGQSSSNNVGEERREVSSGVNSNGVARNDTVSDSSTQKVAAALFFHEHVVSILKVVLANGTSWYDLVDSMPQKIQRKDGEGKMAATRTRCKDRKSLEVTLRWYACSKFNKANMQYIDNNGWDDAMCDFDPRVFQAFVWKE